MVSGHTENVRKIDEQDTKKRANEGGGVVESSRPNHRKEGGNWLQVPVQITKEKRRIGSISPSQLHSLRSL